MTRKRFELRAEFGLSKLADPGVDEDARKVAARIKELTAEQPAHEKPWSAMFSTKLRPMTPKPISDCCVCLLIFSPLF